MRWLTVHIDTSHAGLESVTAMLSALGLDSVMIEDETDFQEFLQDNRGAWDYVDEDLENFMRNRSRVTFYLPDTESGLAQLAETRIALQALRENLNNNNNNNYGPLIMSLENIENADWENNWKKYYKPMKIGEKILIIPAWENFKQINQEINNNNNNNNQARVPVILDPGLAFGTGSHATTRLCLELLESCIHGGERVLDLGCGSGILSITALLLGAESALGIDMDEIAVRVAADNAALNGLEVNKNNKNNAPRFRAVTGNIMKILENQNQDFNNKIIYNKYNIIFANIVADVIIKIARFIPAFLLKSTGVFICSGVINTRHEEVEQALQSAGFTVQAARQSDGWYAYQCAMD